MQLILLIDSWSKYLSGGLAAFISGLLSIKILIEIIENSPLINAANPPDR